MACLAVLAWVAAGTQAASKPAPKKTAKAAVTQPAYCSAAHIPNVSPDPLLGTGSDKVLENNLTLTPGTTGVIGVTAKSGTTGTALSPVAGNAFQIAYIEETEVYEFLNNAGTASKPLSPGASDSGKAILKSLPSGIVNHLNPATPQSTGAGLPYAVILSSNLTTVLGQVPVNIVDQNYTPNPTAWMHATTGSQAQPKPTTCGSGDNLYSLLRFSAASVKTLVPGVTYAALLRVRDTDTSGPLSNHLWYFTPPPKANPKLTTQATPASGSIGDTVKDVATLTGANNPAGGTVHFNLYGPDAEGPDCSGTPVNSTDLTGTVQADGTATSPGVTLNHAGTYHWVATYDGDNQNNPAGPTACDDPAEAVVIAQAQPKIATQASSNVFLTQSVSDTATVTGGHSPTGSVTFTLFGPSSTADCSAGLAVAGSTATVPLDSNGQAKAPAVTPGQPGIYRWVATYNGDGDNAAQTSACDDPAENVQVKPLPVKAYVAYAYAGHTTADANTLPSPWKNSSANVTFVGCGNIAAFASSPCPAGTATDHFRYDAGALRFDVTSGTIALTFTNASVSIGPRCIGDRVYKPWPGLNKTIQPGGTLILTQTGGNATNTCQTDDPNFDTSEASLPAPGPSSPNCQPNGQKPVITVTINGVVVSFTDNGQVLNTGGFDLANCTGKSEFQNWSALN